MSLYTGDDPLEPWGSLVVYLEYQEASSELPQVLDRLVQEFLNVEKYANDIRYVNYCIRCASFYPEPVAVYNHVFSKGVGTRTAALYVSWAKQFEQNGKIDQAEAVFQKALENQAQPGETVLNEHRQFQIRNQIQAPVSAASRTPLQNSNLTNQMSSQREPAAQYKASAECPSGGIVTTITVSRSENSGALPSSQGSGVQTVSQYNTEDLICEGSELCFEELQRSVVESDPGLFPNITQRASVHPRLSSRRSLSLRLHAKPTFIQEAYSSSSEDSQHAPVLADRSVYLPQSTNSEQKMNVSLHGPACTSSEVFMQEDQGNHQEKNHDTQQETAHPPQFEERLNSEVLPSPTVNTREALGVIMDMFQAPTLFQEPFNNTSVLHSAENTFDNGYQRNGGASSFCAPPTAAPFTVFQDDTDKENGSTAAPSVGRSLNQSELSLKSLFPTNPTRPT
ncbi:Mitotic checkpoint serine/threonine-protein kinase BUB1 [Dissostichus eleginoides]|uniref:Mitotic checkpoint serine/threonine-protein kinase BUB1 n=1 Tax=Dissostichus eleginoides TaxID=100907 RepID=A0AAD9BVK2_DISEL|nr:Mitotic checkpoint serine/threonine-protein kinase BUB1 [Dissostichus eleginoides]